MNPATQPLTPSLCAVRAVQPGDYAKIADLAGQLGYPSTEERVRQRIHGMQDSNQYGVLVAEQLDGSIAGWVGVYIFRSVETDICAQISGLVVDQSTRSHGIGRALLDAAEGWARSKGCPAIAVLSNVVRDRAHGFYKDNGYTQVKTQHSFRKNL